MATAFMEVASKLKTQSPGSLCSESPNSNMATGTPEDDSEKRSSDEARQLNAIFAGIKERANQATIAAEARRKENHVTGQ